MCILTLRYSCKVLYRLPSPVHQCCAGAIKTAFEWFASQAGIGIPEWVPLPGTARYLQAVERLDAVVFDIIRTRRRDLETGARQPQVSTFWCLAPCLSAGSSTGNDKAAACLCTFWCLAPCLSAGSSTGNDKAAACLCRHEAGQPCCLANCCTCS